LRELNSDCGAGSGLCQCGFIVAKCTKLSRPEAEKSVKCALSPIGRNAHTSVTAVTDRFSGMGDTSIVNKVQRVSKKALLEPGDTRQQWKGEAATSFVSAGITSSRALPTSSVGYWSPFSSCIRSITGASEETLSFGGVLLLEAHLSHNYRGLNYRERPAWLGFTLPHHNSYEGYAVAR
jgi:hypothetical protein